MTSLFTTTRTLVGLGLGLWLGSCQYEELPEADYPQQVLYMPAAKNGLFTINSLPTTGAYKFTVNVGEKKLIIPLSVFRGGVSVAGSVPVVVTANADTVSKLISTSALVGAVLLPADKLTLPAAVTLDDGKTSAPFDLRIDLDYLRANPGRKLAIGVSIASAQATVNPLLRTTIIALDPAILKPTSDFTARADAATPTKIVFTNTSVNAVSYEWNFGDGSAAVTDAAPTHTYAASGKYTVTLTTTGITGSADAVKKSTVLTIP